MSINVLRLADELRTEADAYVYLENMRWGDGEPTCPHCGTVDAHYFLTPKDGKARKTRTGSASERRVWKCRACRKQFSVLTGTIFHGTKIPVRTWLFVIFDMCSAKNGISAREIERKYDLTPKSAWFMAHRIREAMKREPMAGLLSGTVISDETWIGGKPKNRHGYKPYKGRGPRSDKQPVQTLIHAETGEVRSRVVPNVKSETLREHLFENVDKANTDLHTDEGFGYGPVGRAFRSHETVEHRSGEYVRGDVSTNKAENYFSQLKRSINGTYHHVSVEHLDRYLAEFDYRHSTCKLTDTERVELLYGQVAGRRLAYRPAPSQA
jgi:transposase-like protein